MAKAAVIVLGTAVTAEIRGRRTAAAQLGYEASLPVSYFPCGMEDNRMSARTSTRRSRSRITSAVYGRDIRCIPVSAEVLAPRRALRFPFSPLLPFLGHIFPCEHT